MRSCILVVFLSALLACVPKVPDIVYVQEICAPEHGNLCEPCNGDCKCGVPMRVCCIGDDPVCYAWDEYARSTWPVCEGTVGVCANFVSPEEPPFTGAGICYDGFRGVGPADDEYTHPTTDGNPPP